MPICIFISLFAHQKSCYLLPDDKSLTLSAAAQHDALMGLQICPFVYLSNKPRKFKSTYSNLAARKNRLLS